MKTLNRCNGIGGASVESTFRVVVADDNDRARQAVRMLLNADSQFEVVGEAADGEQAVLLAESLQPDLILMDINMPRLNGLEATRLIKARWPQVTLVILSVSDDAADLFEAIRNGAQGYLVKSLQPTDWVTYLRGVMNGEAEIPRKMADRILHEFRSSELRAQQKETEKLTTRERELLELVRKGLTNREIAESLFISENTVKNHLKNIMTKLHAHNRVQLVAYPGKQSGL